LFRNGERIQRFFETTQGRVEMLYRVNVQGSTLQLDRISIMPQFAERLNLGSPVVQQGLRTLMTEARSQGFETLRLTGMRISGANPGRIQDVLINLKKWELMPEHARISGEVARQLQAGRPLEEVLNDLRIQGKTMGDSVLILASAQEIELDRAQQLIVTSETWRDHREAYDAAENAFWSFLESRGEERDDGSLEINASDL
jgi:hypothetical protein